jgi:nucleoside-diphosphate-sugar epimerase
MAILITGGTGFVGLNLAQQLSVIGEKVVLMAPKAMPIAQQNLFEQLGINYDFCSGSVSQVTDLNHICRHYGITKIVNAAAITADQLREKDHTEEIMAVNLMGSLAVFETALQNSIVQVIQLSSGSIFGHLGTHDSQIDELLSPVLPVTIYGISKLAAERAAIRYRQTRGLNITTVRLGLVYGPWEYDTGHRDTLSLPLQIYWAAKKGEHLVVHDAVGTDYVYSRDVAAGLTKILVRGSSSQELYHLASGLTWSLSDWLVWLKQLFPLFSYEITNQLESCTIGQNGPLPRSPMRIARIKKDFDYQPQFHGKIAFDDFILHQQQLNHLTSI